MKKIFILLVVLVLLGAGFYFFSSSNKAEGLVYKNDKYGFELTLPSSWKSYKVVEINDSIDFCLPSTDKNFGYGDPTGYVCNLRISAYSKPQFSAKSDFIPEDYTGENSKYVFTRSTGQDSPSDWNSILQGLDVTKAFRAF